MRRPELPAAIGADWPVTNRRRGELIEKAEGTGLTPAEREELAELQRLADQRTDMLDPFGEVDP